MGLNGDPRAGEVSQDKTDDLGMPGNTLQRIMARKSGLKSKNGGLK